MFEFCKTRISYCVNIFILNIIGKCVIVQPPPCIWYFLQNIISYIDDWFGKYFLIDCHCFVLKRTAKNWPEIIAVSLVCYASPFDYQNLYFWGNRLQVSCTDGITICVVLHTHFDIFVFLFWKSKATHIKITHYHMW